MAIGRAAQAGSSSSRREYSCSSRFSLSAAEYSATGERTRTQDPSRLLRPDKGQTLDPSVKSRKCILIAQSRGLQQPQITPIFGRFGKITENRFDKTFV